MAINYLTDFTKVLDDSLETYDGISHAIGLESSDDFRKQKTYKNEVVRFRKSIRTKPILTLTDIFNIIEDFVDEDTLSLYSIEKAFTFIKEYKGSESVIKSIMNKFDKSLRQSINKDILNQYGIEAKVRRSSRYNFESINNNRIVDSRKGDPNSGGAYYHSDESKSPTWEIRVKIPIKQMKVSNSEDEKFKVDVPFPENTYVRLTVNYAFRPLTQFFINNITKLEEYKKDISLFVKDLMKHTDRQLSFSTNVWTSINLDSHPYIVSGRAGNSGNWCQGQWSTELNRAYKEMDITLLSTSVYEWMTNYCIGETQPHNDITTMYTWLPDSAGENGSASNMPSTDRMQSDCWSDHESNKICEQRECAFVHKCEYYLQSLNDKPTTEADLSGLQVPASDSSPIEPMFVDDVNQNYAPELYAIFNSQPDMRLNFQRAFLGLRSHVLEHTNIDDYEMWETIVSDILAHEPQYSSLPNGYAEIIQQLNTALGFSIDAICQIGYYALSLFGNIPQINNLQAENEEENL